MRYISTRGECPSQSFEEVLLTGLAPDGGLYIPEALPKLSREQIMAWQGLSYADLAFEIISLFIDTDAIPEKDLKTIINDSYAEFSHPKIAPLTNLGENLWLLELYHGPTLAFKDFALQLLGRLLDYFLARRQQYVAILGATSGDTGSAALEGCRHCQYVDMFILHPHNRVSDVQRLQMTTIPGDNIHNLAIEGNFDDCQEIVKQAFANQNFLPDGCQLVAVNSINWARIMAQIVYYFYASLNFMDKFPAVSFSVPTGNFGDIYAGYLAKKMGLPIKQLIIATNKNDILHRFISQNNYSKMSLEASLSPSMDIMVSSNFERFLFDLFAGDGARVKKFVTSLNENKLQVSESEWAQARDIFASASISDDETCQTIKEIFASAGIVLDPHSAIGVKAAQSCNENKQLPMISLATAHPSKFSVAIERAGLIMPELPQQMDGLFEKEERYEVLPNSVASVKDYIKQSLPVEKNRCKVVKKIS